MNKRKLVLAIVYLSIIGSIFIGCSNENKTSNNLNIIIEENHIEDTNSSDEETSNLPENNISDILVEENDGTKGIQVFYNDEYVTGSFAIGGVTDWMPLEQTNSAQKYSYLVAPEKTGDIRTYKYQKLHPDYDKANIDEDSSESYKENYIGLGVASETIFKYNASDDSIDMSHDGVDVVCKKVDGINYLITVDGKETYKLIRYDTGRTYTNSDDGINRAMYGFRIEILSSNEIIKPIDAITVALIVINGEYVIY